MARKHLTIRGGRTMNNGIWDYCQWCEECTDQFTRDHVDCTEIICGRCDRVVERIWKDDDGTNGTQTPDD